MVRNTFGRPAQAGNDRGPERRSKRRQPEPAPTPDDVKEALSALLDHSIPGTPPLSALRTLEQAGISPTLEVGDRVIRDYSVTKGNPRHGEMRSDDHVSYYEVEYPNRCPECEHPTAVYEVKAYHHISGRETKYCPYCDEVHHNEQWG